MLGLLCHNKSVQEKRLSEQTAAARKSQKGPWPSTTNSKQGHTPAGDENSESMPGPSNVRSIAPRGQPSPQTARQGVEGCEGASLDPSEPWWLMLRVSNGYHI